MKQRMLKGIVILTAGAAVLAACQKDERNGDAYISFTMSSGYHYGSTTRAPAALPDTNDFILSVYDSDGEPVYDGPYGDRPEPMQVPSGSYDISLHSIIFEEPAFESPLYGDYRSVIAGSGETLSVAFGCTQLNCGMRLIFSESFIERFKDSEISLTAEEMSLPYPFSESRTAYFNPGIIQVVSENDGSTSSLLSRRLEAADILTLKLSASAETSSGDGFTIEVDTSRNWIYEDFTLGSGNNGSSADKALTVTDLSMHIGAEEVWVCGYIVGGDMSKTNIRLEAPFSKDSHLAIADTPEVSDREQCAAVELPEGKVRDALNLVSNPDNIGKKIYLKGSIENYFSYPGVKKVKEFLLE